MTVKTSYLRSGVALKSIRCCFDVMCMQCKVSKLQVYNGDSRVRFRFKIANISSNNDRHNPLSFTWACRDCSADYFGRSFSAETVSITAGLLVKSE